MNQSEVRALPAGCNRDGSNNFTLCVYDYIVFVLEDLLVVDLSSYLLPAILMYTGRERLIRTRLIRSST